MSNSELDPDLNDEEVVDNDTYCDMKEEIESRWNGKSTFEGTNIQYRPSKELFPHSKQDWADCEPIWDWRVNDYRVKPNR